MVDVATGTTQRITGTPSLTLTAAVLVPIRVRYYQATGLALIALYWKIPGGSSFDIIASSALYHKTLATSITAAPNILEARHTPRMATGLAQGSSATYEAAALTITWTAPTDTGCLPVADYTIQATTHSDDCCWVDITTGISGLSGRAADAAGAATPYVVAGQSVSLRVLARNSLNIGEPSDRITLVPAALPIAPAAIRVTYGQDGSLALDWDASADTGGGDAIAIAPATVYYMLEVDEGFYEGAAAGGGAATVFTPLTSNDPTGLVKHTALTFTHTNLIVGHAYHYRVKAANLMGYGLYSATFTFTPRKRPGTPPLAPRNVPASTTRSTIFIEYDAVLETGGATITQYTVYLDDGTDSDNFAAHSSGTTLTFDTAGLTTGGGGPLVLTAGLTYRLKYTATNVAGEGPLSAEVSVLLAEKPGLPGTLRRIDI